MYGIDIVEIMQRLNKADEESKHEEKYLRELQEEQWVLPSIGNLPRVIRQFVHG